MKQNNITQSFNRAIEPDDAMISKVPIVENKDFIQGFLRNNIEKVANLVFMLGTDKTRDVKGMIKEIGIDYIVVHDYLSNEDVVGNVYNIKSVQFPFADQK